MGQHTGPDADTLVFTSATGLPLRGGSFRTTWRQATKAAGLDGLRLLRPPPHLCRGHGRGRGQPKAVSTWAGHSSVAFTLDRYGHLMEGHDDEVSYRLDAMLSTVREESAKVARIG
jgi:integrase